MRQCATTLKPEMTEKESALLSSVLKKENLKGRHLEIGTAAGGTLCSMMAAYDTESRPSFTVVDPMAYFANQRETVERNLRNHDIDPGTVDFRMVTSAEAYMSACARKESYSFILIDGVHKIRYVMDDLRWASLLEEGGILCLHDYNEHFPDVTKALDRFLRKNRQYQLVDHADSLIVLRKVACRSKREVSTSDRLYALALAPLLQWQRSVRKRVRKKIPASNK